MCPQSCPSTKIPVNAQPAISHAAASAGICQSSDRPQPLGSISTTTAEELDHGIPRKIALRVYGTSGWDRDAFLMPGVDLKFNEINYKNFAVVVLNLQAPSVLLGFQVGGIVGHKFLSPYRVSLDLNRSELRMSKAGAN